MRLVLFSLLIITSCSVFNKEKYSQEQKIAHSKQLNAFFEEVFKKKVSRSPTWQTYIGKKTNYGKLNNATQSFSEETHEMNKTFLVQLKTYNRAKLTQSAQLSYDLFEKMMSSSIDGYKWRYHSYPLNQMFGYHSSIPSFMINMHSVKNESEAKDYLSRLKEVRRFFSEMLVFVNKQKTMGIMPPNFVYDKVIGDSQNIITGAPFAGKADSPLLKDFKSKVNKLKISKSQKKALIKRSKDYLKKYVGPSYRELISFMKETKKIKTDNHAAWSLPDGDDYYRWRLKKITTTDMEADEIHNYGLLEVKRIHREMIKIKNKVGFEGSLHEFFKHMKTSSAQQFPDSDKGRDAYLAKADSVLAKMKEALPKMFHTIPKSPLKVRPVEAYREKSAGIAFYQSPPLYGDRPGIYYVNLYDMKDMPKYKLEALAYHEGLPGHHLQNAVQSELDGLPKFRRVAHYTAYGEGWGLYSEYLPKEYGFYKDPYSDFGRLSMELWRACRLVTDTALHHKKWSREKAIKYLKDNTANADLEIVKGIERYIVMPGQATAYKIGMKKILDLRAWSRQRLKEKGIKFDIRDFHEVILTNGAMPLDLLEKQVKAWVHKG